MIASSSSSIAQHSADSDKEDEVTTQRFFRGRWGRALRRCLLGQVVAFAVAGTGVFTTLLVNQNRSFPLLQSVTSYAALVLVYVPLYAFVLRSRLGWWTAAPTRAFKDFTPLSRWWRYPLIAIVDLEANYVVVKAYQYTDMTSVQLLDCFTVPFVMLLSYCFLSARYTATQLIGAVVAVGGLALLVGLDADGLSRSSGGPNLLLGDGLCVISSALYAVSNVACEKLIKGDHPPHELTEHRQVSNTPERHSNRGGTLNPSAASNDGVVSMTNTLSSSSTASMTEPAPLNHPRDEAHERSILIPSQNSASLDTLDVSIPTEQLPSPLLQVAPSYLSTLEYLACMPLFALLFAVVQCAAVEGDAIIHSFRKDTDGGGWSSSAIAYQILFGLSMLTVYTGMPLLFHVSSATLANLSLLTADVYAIIWNVTIFHIHPRWEFFLAYWITVTGIVWFDTDGFQGRVTAATRAFLSYITRTTPPPIE